MRFKNIGIREDEAQVSLLLGRQQRENLLVALNRFTDFRKGLSTENLPYRPEGMAN